MAYTTLAEKIVFVSKSIKKINNIDAYECFPVNFGSDNIMKTALYWARGYKDNIVPEQFIYDNKEFDDVTITGLEVRGEGGRAYKVLVKIEDKYFYVDLREEALMNTIMEYGIDVGGKLKGKYIFIQEGSNMKLCLVGSRIHLDAIENEEKKKLKKISNSNLTPGNVYQNVSGDQMIFLGMVYGKNFKIEENHEKRHTTYGFKEGKVDKRYIFVKVYNRDSVQKEIEEILNNKYLFYFKIQSSHAYKEDLGSCGEIDFKFVIDKLIDVGKKRTLESVEMCKPNRFSSRFSKYERKHFEDCMMYHHLSNSKDIETNTEIKAQLDKILEKM